MSDHWDEAIVLLHLACGLVWMAGYVCVQVAVQARTDFMGARSPQTAGRMNLASLRQWVRQ